jgi:hypothetical protein
MLASQIHPGQYATEIAGIKLDSLLVEDRRERVIDGLSYVEITLWSNNGMITMTVSHEMPVMVAPVSPV